MTIRSSKTLAAVAFSIGLVGAVSGCSGGGAAPVPKASTAAPSASHASDESVYLQVLRGLSSAPGYGQLASGKISDSALVAAGKTVCSELRGHESVAAVTKGMQQKGWSVIPIGAILGSATNLGHGLCPDQNVVVINWMHGK
jgi:hypothetical protein